MLASSGIGLKLWSLDTLELVREYPIIGRNKQLAQINSFHVKPDSSQLAAIVDKDFISLINLETQIQTDFKDSTDFRCCSFDYSGRHLAAGDSNGYIEIYDFKTSSLKKRRWKVQSNCAISCLCFNKSDRYLATGSSNGSIVLYNSIINQLGKPWLHSSHVSSPSAVTSIQYSTVNTLNLGASYEDGSVVLWDGNKEQPISLFKSHSSPCTSLVLSPLNFILMVSGGLDSIFVMYDTTAKKPIKTVNCSGGITSLDLLKNGSTLAVGSANGYLHTYDLRYLDAPFASTKAHDTSVHCVKFVQNIVLQNTNGNNSVEKMKMNFNNESIVNNSNNNNEYSSCKPTPENVNFMKRSNSYNFDLAPNQQPYSIYSPEMSNKQDPTFTLNHQRSNPFSKKDSSDSDSFILHKKPIPSSNSGSSLSTQLNFNINNTSTEPTQIISGNYNNQNLNGNNNGSLNLKNDEFKPNHFKTQQQNFQSKFKTELFSPLNNSNNLTKNLISSTGISSGTTVLFKNESNQTSNSQNPLIFVNNEEHIEMELGTPTPNNFLTSRNGSGFKEKSPNLLVESNKNNKNQATPASVSQSTKNFRLQNNNSNMNGFHETNQLNQDNQQQNNLDNDQSQATNNLVLPIDQIREIVYDKIEDLRDEWMNESFQFKSEMFKEFSLLKKEVKKYFELFSPNEALLSELSRLREENKRLKKLF